MLAALALQPGKRVLDVAANPASAQLRFPRQVGPESSLRLRGALLSRSCQGLSSSLSSPSFERTATSVIA
jgi:hypothetical protein